MGATRPSSLRWQGQYGGACRANRDGDASGRTPEGIESRVRRVSASHVRVPHRRRRHAGVRGPVAGRSGCVVVAGARSRDGLVVHAVNRSRAQRTTTHRMRTFRETFVVPMRSRFSPSGCSPNRQKPRKVSTRPTDISAHRARFRGSVAGVRRARRRRPTADRERPGAWRPKRVRRIACDSAIVRILETGDGEPLDIGRKTRVIPPSMHRALKRRDRGCRFPGCVNTRSSMATTSRIGPTAARRVSTTSCCCAGTIIGCCTKAATTS